MIWPWTRYAAELREVNKIRTSLDFKPIAKMPKGVRQSADSCPIARALDHGHSSIGDTRWLVWIGNGTYRDGSLPPILRDFIEAFDLGEYPELVDEE